VKKVLFFSLVFLLIGVYFSSQIETPLLSQEEESSFAAAGPTAAAPTATCNPCTPGTSTCVIGIPPQKKTCNTDGCSYTYTSCPNGCSGGQCLTPAPTATPDCRGNHDPPSPGICEGLGSNSAGDGYPMPAGGCNSGDVPVGPCCCPQTIPGPTATPIPAATATPRPACPPGSTNYCSPNYGCCATNGNICRNSTGSNCPTPTPTPKPCGSRTYPQCSGSGHGCPSGKPQCNQVYKGAATGWVCECQ